MQTPDVHRLEETYRQMTDGELLKLAEDLDSLTDQAKEALNAELRRRGLEGATAPSLPVPAEAAGPETPELRQLKETYGHMTDAEILRLATEMDSLPDQTADVLYAEVCRRRLEAAVAEEVLGGFTRWGWVSSLAWSPDGKALAAARQDTVKVWDAETGKELLTLSVNGARELRLAWSPDGKRLAAADHHAANVWNAETGEKLLALDLGDVYSVAWSPDGKRLASASGDTAKVWDAETGKELLTLSGYWVVAWSPDGKRLATGAIGNAVKVWDAETGLTVSEPGRWR